MDERRTLRISEAVKEELSEIIGFETHDPRLTAVEVTDVHVSPDGRHANIVVALLIATIKASLVGLFWACSSSLLPEILAWAVHRGEHAEPVLRGALAAAHEFAAHGTEVPDAVRLLAGLKHPPLSATRLTSSQQRQRKIAESALTLAFAC